MALISNLIKLALIPALCFSMTACGDIKASIVGKWQCPTTVLTITENDTWKTISDHDGHVTVGNYSLSYPEGWAARIEGIDEATFRDLQYIKSKPILLKITSFNGLILFSKTKEAQVQCQYISD